MTDDLPAAPAADEYSPDQITIYGIKLNATAKAKIPFDNLKLKMDLEYLKRQRWRPVPNTYYSITVAYGYSFEGYCYRFEKPKVYVIMDEYGANPGDPAVGCGFDSKAGTVNQYTMWKIRSKKMLIELAASYDAADQLILEANLPGNRTAKAYGVNMQLAHRARRVGTYGDSG